MSAKAAAAYARRKRKIAPDHPEVSRTAERAFMNKANKAVQDDRANYPNFGGRSCHWVADKKGVRRLRCYDTRMGRA